MMIEFWFDFSSPYAYFAATEVDALAARHEARVLWRPFLLGVVFDITGMRPLTETPLRGAYARRDWARLSRRLGIAFELPAAHPAAQLASSRLFYCIERENPELAREFARAIFAAYFGQGRNTGEREIVADIAAQVGVDRSLVNAMQLPEAKEALRAKTAEAIGKGVFGSPFFIVEGEPFWGHDRLPLIEQWLSRGPW